MPKITPPAIKHPCPANWNKMKIGLDSRFCFNCQKPVMDFTQMRREDILSYLIQNYQHRTCARIRKEQLDFMIEDLEVVVQAALKHQQRSNLPFFALALGALLIVGCDTEVPGLTAENEKLLIEQQEVAKDNEAIDDTASDAPIEEGDNADLVEIPITGEIVFAADDSAFEAGKAVHPVDAPLYFAEKAPEFPGGMEAMMHYFKEQLVYPPEDRARKLEGNVFVQFVVDKQGKILHPTILRSHSENASNEVLLVFKGMPLWVPGEQEGKAVAVYFTLPVRFKL